MGIFSRQKKLIDYDPKDLDIETLSHLQASLAAKLILVNEELFSRYVNIAALGDGLPNSSVPRHVLMRGAERLQKFNSYLEDELALIAGKKNNLDIMHRNHSNQPVARAIPSTY